MLVGVHVLSFRTSIHKHLTMELPSSQDDTYKLHLLSIDASTKSVSLVTGNELPQSNS